MWQIKVSSNPDGRHPEVEYYNSDSHAEALNKFYYLMSIKSDDEEISRPYLVHQ